MVIDERALPSLDLRQLYYFVVLAQQGTISGAAAALGLAQPSLSENIARLERRLGVTLAVRGGRGVQLTEAGLTLARHAQELVRSAELAVHETRHVGGEPRGQVSVGTVASLASQLSGPLAETILHEYPLVRLHIAEALSGDLIDWIESGQLDLACIYNVHQSSNIVAEALFIEDMLLTTAPDNWAGEIGPDGRALESITPQRLAELPLVLPSARHGLRKIVDRYARANGINLNVVMEIDSLPQLAAMVDRASAYTILPASAVREQVVAGTLALVGFGDTPLQRTAYLVRRRTSPITRASLTVEAVMKSIITEMIQRQRLDAQLLIAPDTRAAAGPDQV